MWQMESDLLKNYVSKGLPVPPDRAELPAAMATLIGEYFYIADAPIYAVDIACTDASAIKLRPGLLQADTT